MNGLDGAGGRLSSQALCLGRIGRKAAGTLIDNAMRTDEGKAGVTVALLAAALFGASTPVNKLLLGRIDPLLLAGLLYLGSGL